MVILGAGVYPRLEARGHWRSGVKGRELCGWETLVMIGGFETEATDKAGSRRWGEGIGGGMEVS